MEQIAAFYRVDDDGIFHQAPNFVRAPDYDLFKEDKDTYTYPTEGGWYWFDTLEEAKQFFNIQD
jgi:hypothetical protein